MSPKKTAFRTLTSGMPFRFYVTGKWQLVTELLYRSNNLKIENREELFVFLPDKHYL